jgi:SAM-dependent methyltransferase
MSAHGDRELEYHERLYAGFAQRHFAKPAVRALRAHLAARILKVSGAGERSRVLSLGCGIGDTELLLAPRVASLLGVDLSPAAVRQARADGAAFPNAEFREGTVESVDGRFDLILAVFFLHHLPTSAQIAAAAHIRGILAPGGVFYSLDPSRYRLSGAVGNLLFPKLMQKYQSPDERPLDPAKTVRMFREAGFACRAGYYDFLSSPLAGLFPSWRSGYAAARAADEILTRMPLLRRLGSNLEIVARLA